MPTSLSSLALRGLRARQPQFAQSLETNPLRRSTGFEGADTLPSPFELGQARDISQRNLLGQGQQEQAIASLRELYGSPSTVRERAILPGDIDQGSSRTFTTQGAPSVADVRSRREAPTRKRLMGEATEDVIRRFTGTTLPLEQYKAQQARAVEDARIAGARERAQIGANATLDRGMMSEAGRAIAGAKGKIPQANERFGAFQQMLGLNQKTDLRQSVADMLDQRGLSYSDQELDEILNDPNALQMLGIQP